MDVHLDPRPSLFPYVNIEREFEDKRVKQLRALLLPDNVQRRWKQRDLQAHSRPNGSLVLVNKVVRHLRDEAFIEESDDGFRLRDLTAKAEVGRAGHQECR